MLSRERKPNLFFVLFVIVFFAPYFALAKEFNQRPKIVLFLLHGFGGGENTFCDLEAILTKKYNSHVKVKTLVYPTFGTEEIDDDDIAVRDFLPKVHQDIIDFYKQENIDPKTPFGFVMHSQGGIVGLHYSRNCIKKSICTKDPYFGELGSPKDIRMFITYGTPFWGSPTAAKLEGTILISKLLMKEQLVELAYGSNRANMNRQSILNYVRNDIKDVVPPTTKVINVAGEIKKVSGVLRNLIDRITSKNLLSENDLVVANSSARFDFYYKTMDKNDRIIEGKTKFVDKYYTVNHPHVSIEGSSGLACFKDSKNDSVEDFVSYQILRTELGDFLKEQNLEKYFIAEDLKKYLNQKVQIRDDVKGLSRFLSEVRMNLPTGFRQNINYGFDSDEPIENVVRIRVTDNKIKQTVIDESILNRYAGFNTRNLTQRNPFLVFYHEAEMQDRFSWTHKKEGAESKLIYSINIPGFYPTSESIKVSPSYSSYLELNLKPILPEVGEIDKCQKAILKQRADKAKVYSYPNLDSSIRRDMKVNLQVKALERRASGAFDGTYYENDFVKIKYQEAQSSSIRTTWAETKDVLFLGFCH